MEVDGPGTGFAALPADLDGHAGSGNNGAGDRVISSGGEVPHHAVPLCLCLRVLPVRRGTQFTVQILDLATGHVLDEQPPQRLGELPEVLASVSRWVFCR